MGPGPPLDGFGSRSLLPLAQDPYLFKLRLCTLIGSGALFGSGALHPVVGSGAVGLAVVVCGVLRLACARGRGRGRGRAPRSKVEIDFCMRESACGWFSIRKSACASAGSY